jgi:hypothetical protein
MMEIPCYWAQVGMRSHCPNIACHIIIYTCWNGHLQELAVCNQHMNQWTKEFASYWLYCRTCPSEVVEWDHVDVRKLIVKYARKHLELEPPWTAVG